MSIQGFWGLQVEPGKQYTQKVAVPFMITMASLPETMTGKTRSSLTIMVDSNIKYSLCSLTPYRMEQQFLNLNLVKGEEVTFAVRGENAIHLTGNYVFDLDDEDHHSSLDAIQNNYQNTKDNGKGIDESDNHTTNKGKPIDVFDYDEEHLQFSDDEEFVHLDRNSLKRSGDANNMHGQSKKRKDRPSSTHGTDELQNLINQQSLEMKSALQKPTQQKQPPHQHTTTSSTRTPGKSKPSSIKANLMEPVIEIKLDDDDYETPRSEEYQQSTKQQQVAKKKRDATRRTAVGGIQKHNDTRPSPKNNNNGSSSSSNRNNNNNNNNNNNASSPSSSPTPSSPLVIGLAKNNDTLKTTSFPNGMVAKDKRIGSGQSAQFGDRVGIRYLGKLQNGTVFARHITGAPYEISLHRGHITQGWHIAVLGMKIGGERQLTIPAALACQSGDLPRDLPQNTTLTIDIQMVTLTS